MKIERPALIQFKCTDEEKKSIVAASKRDKMGLAEWVRGAAIKATAEPEPVEKQLIVETQAETLDRWKAEADTKLPDPEPPKPATNSVYQSILNRQGKAAADAWAAARAKPIPIVINDPVVPPHLKPFYDNLVRTQGRPAADCWLLTNNGGKKL
jgi:hypothetical protein